MSVQRRKVDGRTLRHQHRRPELLAATVEYVLEHGVADLSLRPMADALGVTHATLLRHFGSKEALVTEAVISIRRGIGVKLDASGDGSLDAPPATAMRAVWKQLCQPVERRQFVLLFELVAMQARDPDRFGSLVPMLIGDFLTPLESRFRKHGWSPREARDLATGFLAMVRGLQLDFAVSGEQKRVDAAMERYIDTVTRRTDDVAAR